jgi:hypothetical protein
MQINVLRLPGLHSLSFAALFAGGCLLATNAAGQNLYVDVSTGHSPYYFSNDASYDLVEIGITGEGDFYQSSNTLNADTVTLGVSDGSSLHPAAHLGQ